MSGDDGTPKIDPVTAVVAASGVPFTAPESHIGDEGQSTVSVVNLTDLPPAVTSLSQDECDVASSNLVNLGTTTLRELTPSEASNLLNESQDCSGADEAKAPLPLRNQSDDSSPKKQPTWADQPSIDKIGRAHV